MRFWLLLIFTFLLGSLVQGQIRVSQSTFDYGKVKVWKNDTFTFTVKNKGNTSAKLLPTYNPRVQLIGPASIAAGSEAEFKIVAYPRAKGYFEFNPKFYFNNSLESLNLTIKGNIKSFDESALYNCPKLQNDPIKFKHKQLKIEIRDSKTKRVIYHAQSELSNPFNNLIFNGGYGKINTFHGEYTISSQAEGYESRSIKIFFDDASDVFIMYLNPLADEEEMDDDYEPTSDETISLEDVNEEEEVQEEFIEKNDSTNALETNNNKKSILEKLLKTEDKVEENKEEKKPEVVEIVEEEEEDKDEEKEEIKEEQAEKKDPIQEMGEKLQKSELPPQHIIVLADVSFSMRRGGYIDDLKKSLQLTLQYLRPQDSLTIITFSTSNLVLADHIGAAQKDSIALAIEEIKARGGTNAKIALKSGYGVSKRYESKTSRTRILLFTDGQFNTPGTSQNWYANYVKENYAPKNYQLDILLFSARESDYRFLSPISEAGKGKTHYLGENLTLFLLKLLNE